VFPRTSAFRSVFRSSAARTARLRSTSRTWRTASRRGYASDHGHGKKSSDLPWIIGSVVVTVPSAAWLIQQGPKPGDHGHGHDDHGEHKAHKEGEEEHTEEASGEDKDQGSNESNDEGEEKPKDDAEAESDEGDKDDSSDDSEKADTPATSDDEEPPPGQVKKGKGEKQKGETRPKTETKGEKDAATNKSGAENPYLADPEKSKKGEGVKDSAKIHGTVDTGRNLRSPGEGEQQEKTDPKLKEKPSSVQS